MVIAVADVPRWEQPDLERKSSFGEAYLAFVGAGEVEVGAAAAARVVVSVRPVTEIPVDDTAEFSLYAGLPVFPLLVAEASVPIITVWVTTDYHATAAVCAIQLTGKAVTDIAGEAVALVGIGVRFPQAVEVFGDAEVSFGDFGMDVPIFPFGFPYQFTDESLIPRGIAAVYIDGVGSVDAVGVSGEARLSFRGSVPLRFQGSVPVFPFGFPAVFDEAAVVRLGAADVVLARPFGEVSVVLAGDAEIALFGSGDALNGAVFPWTLSAVFSEV